MLERLSKKKQLMMRGNKPRSLLTGAQPGGSLHGGSLPAGSLHGIAAPPALRTARGSAPQSAFAERPFRLSHSSLVTAVTYPFLLSPSAGTGTSSLAQRNLKPHFS